MTGKNLIPIKKKQTSVRLLCYVQVIEYLGYPKQSDMNIMFNESMMMPNITFCMSRQQAWSHFNINSSEDVEEWDRIVQVCSHTQNIQFI